MWRRMKRLFISSGYTRESLLYVCALLVFLCHVVLHRGGGGILGGDASAAGNSAPRKRSQTELDSSSTARGGGLLRHLEAGAPILEVVGADPANLESDIARASNLTKLAWGVGGDAAAAGANVYRPPRTSRYQYNCSNIHEITIKRKLGHGVSKQVFLGTHEGRKLAVKMVTRNVLDVTSCVKKRERQGTNRLQDRSQCYFFPNMKLMKEILILEQIEHPNLMKMLGYCVRSEETDSTSLEEHGIVAVYEYALRFYTSTVAQWPFQLRLKTVVELADLLDYLEHSPLGSLRIADFKDAHFLLKDGRIKLIDMDDVTSLEASCGHESNQPDTEGSGPRICDYNLKCVGGICPGQNAKRNLEFMHKLFFREILFEGTSKDVDKHGAAILAEARQRLDDNVITARELKTLLYALMNMPYIPGYS